MKHLLSILLICSIGFTQELTVDGNLNVTGNIQNQTIDSLLQVIQSLESQLSALQGGVTSKIIAYNINLGGGGDGIVVPISEVIGYELERGSIQFLGFDGEVEDFFLIEYGFNSADGYESSSARFYINPYYNSATNDGSVSYYFDSNVNSILFDYQANSSLLFDGVLYFLVTAQFPLESNVQQRKPGLQSKDKETVK